MGFCSHVCTHTCTQIYTHIHTHLHTHGYTQMAYILAVNAGILRDTGGTCSPADCQVRGRPMGDGQGAMGAVGAWPVGLPLGAARV